MSEQGSQNLNGRAKGSMVGRKFHFWLAIVLFFIVALAIILVWMAQALPRIAIAEISKLTNTKIDAESIDFHLDGSVYLKNLIIRPNRDRLYDDAILKAKSVYARFSISSLLLLGPSLKEIHISDFIFDAQFDLDTGRWNIDSLAINVPEGDSGKMPRLRLEKGKLRYIKISKGRKEVTVSMPVEAIFGLDEETPYGYSFTITTAALSGGLGKSKLTGFWKPGSITITGGISSQDIASLERKWTINVLAAELKYDQDRNYSLMLRMKDVQSRHSPTARDYQLVKPAFIESSGPFTALQKMFGRYCPAGTADVKLQALGNLDQLGETAISGKVHCKDVSICDQKFPYTLEHLAGQIEFTEDSMVLNKLSGKHGEVDVNISGWSRGYGQNRQYQIRVTSPNMALNEDLYKALSAGQKRLWDAFSPSGLALINYRFSRQSPTDKNRNLTVELLDAEAVYKGFAYPLKNLTGKVFFDRNSIVISDVFSQVKDCKIKLNGSVTQRDTEHPVYYISINASEVPLDTTLEAALPSKQRDFYSRFDMTGTVDADIKVFTEKTVSAQISYIAEVLFQGASLKVGGSRMSISDVSAKAVITPDSISLTNFIGRYDQAEVSLSGGIDLADVAQPFNYHLAVNGKNVQLDSDLIGLLPERVASFVSEWQPEGKVDFSADLNKTGDDGRLEYNIVVHCLGNNITNRRFTYTFDDVTGRLTISNHSIVFEDVSAATVSDSEDAESESRIRVNGQIALVDGAFNAASFTLSARDLLVDDSLKAALAESVVASYQELLPTGCCDLDFPEIRITSVGDGSTSIGLSGSTTFKGSNFNMSGTTAELHGILTTKFFYRTGSGFSSGWFSLVADSLKIKGKSVTNLKAELNYNPSLRNWTCENLIADCYGGDLIGKLEIRPRARWSPRYLLQMGFNHVDLKSFLSAGRPKEDVEKGCTGGTMSAALSVGVRVGDSSIRLGRCRISIVDMEVGKVSPLAKLLYVLSLTEPKDFAFEQMLVDSYVKDEKLLVERFDMSGETLAFYGSGSVDLPSEEVNLTLIARGQRLAAGEPSMLQSLTEGLGGAVVRMQVTGNAYDPHVETKALPVIEDSLKILGTPR
jgi:hypothetical protein